MHRRPVNAQVNPSALRSQPRAVSVWHPHPRPTNPHQPIPKCDLFCPLAPHKRPIHAHLLVDSATRPPVVRPNLAPIPHLQKIVANLQQMLLVSDAPPARPTSWLQFPAQPTKPNTPHPSCGDGSRATSTVVAIGWLPQYCASILGSHF